MSAVLVLEGVGPATKCQAANYHSPAPIRFVWHHILPQEAGGKTVADNLAQLCDSCHFATHAILYQLAHNNGQLTTLAKYKGTARYALALQGYQQAAAAGLLGKIPNEGGGGPAKPS